MIGKLIPSCLCRRPPERLFGGLACALDPDLSQGLLRTTSSGVLLTGIDLLWLNDTYDHAGSRIYQDNLFSDLGELHRAHLRDRARNRIGQRF